MLMASIFTHLPQFSPPHTNSSFSTTKRRITIRSPTTLNSTHHSRQIVYNFHKIKFPEGSRISQCSSRRRRAEELLAAPEVSRSSTTLRVTDEEEEEETSVITLVVRPMLLALFFLVLGFCPLQRFQSRAIAAPVLAAKKEEEVISSKKERKSNPNPKGHEYSDCTRMLLETVSKLVREVEEARKCNDGEVKSVEEALKEVRLKKEELQGEIMSGLYAEARELDKEKSELVNRSEEIVEMVLKAKREKEKLSRKAGSGSGEDDEVKAKTARLEESLSGVEEEYNVIWEKVGEIEDKILRKETMAMSIGVRELCFIERESELLVERFKREMRRRSMER